MLISGTFNVLYIFYCLHVLLLTCFIVYKLLYYFSSLKKLSRRRLRSKKQLLTKGRLLTGDRICNKLNMGNRRLISLKLGKDSLLPDKSIYFILFFMRSTIWPYNCRPRTKLLKTNLCSTEENCRQN